MKQLFLFLIMASVMGPQTVLASKIIGNGGMAVRCAKDPKVRLLDLYEAESMHFVAPHMPQLTLLNPAGEDYRQKFLTVLARIADRFPDLARQIHEEFKNFENHTLIMTEANLGDTNDDYHVVLPKECELQNVAIQREPMFPRSPWFIISAELWNLMDDQHRAALVLHETLYRIGVKNGLEHSLGVRYLVGLFFANEMESIGDEDWIKAFVQSRIRNYEIGSLKVPLFTGAFSPCRPAPGTASCMRSEVLKEAELRYNAGRRIQMVSYGPIEENVEFLTNQSVKVSMKVKELSFDWSRPYLELDSEGRMTLEGQGGQVAMNFKGKIQPYDGQFDGTQSVVDGRDRLVLSRTYNGPFTSILANYGISGGYTPPVTVENSRTASGSAYDWSRNGN